MSASIGSFDACHQVIGVFADRDAVGGHALEMRHAFRSLGVRAEIYAHEVVGADQGALPLATLPPDDGRTLLVYQASAASPAAAVTSSRTEPVVVNYHNVTPPSFFAPWEPQVASELEIARAQIADVARRAVGGLADSRYNADELLAMGCPRVEVVPVLIDLERLSSRSSDRRPTPGTRWLFVGRLCPNKAQHDVIKSFALYRRLFDPDATLALIGRSSSHRYKVALRGLIAALHIEHHVSLLGSVTDDELASQYAAANVFVCLSEHEGFCNTVVEAMATDTPVLAYASSAVPETVGHGALLLDDKDPLRVATAAQRVITDDDVRSALVAAGRRRVRDLDLDVARATLADALGRIAR